MLYVLTLAAHTTSASTTYKLPPCSLFQGCCPQGRRCYAAPEHRRQTQPVTQDPEAALFRTHTRIEKRATYVSRWMYAHCATFQGNRWRLRELRDNNAENERRGGRVRKAEVVTSERCGLSRAPSGAHLPALRGVRAAEHDWRVTVPAPAPSQPRTSRNTAQSQP